VTGIKTLIKPSLLFALIMAAAAIGLNGSVILVARMLGGAAVAVVVTTRTLANVARTIPTILCWALWPELTRLDAVGDKGGLRTGHSLLVASYMWISIAFVGAFWFEGQGLIGLWTRGHLSAEPWLIRTFLLYTLCQAPWMASSMLAGATNRHRTMAWCQFYAAVAGVLFVALLLPRLKLIAVPLGLLAGEAIACYHFVIADGCALTNTPYRGFAIRTWLTLLFVTAFTLAMSALAHRLPIASLPLRAAAAGTVSGIAATAGVWKLFLHDSERRLLAGRFTHLALAAEGRLGPA
jgi:O-antigen/teichoic acid export membrane protein